MIIKSSVAGKIGVCGIYAVYLVWWNVSVWCCAFNVEHHKIWGYLARLSLLPIMLAIIGFMMGLGMLSYVYSGLTPAEKEMFKIAASESVNTEMPSTENKVDIDVISKCLEQLQTEMARNDPNFKPGAFLEECKTKTKPTDIILNAPVDAIIKNPQTSAPMLPDTNSAPLPSITGSAPDTQKYKEACEKTLTDYAIAGGADPAQYLAENQDYVQKCVEFHENKDSENRPPAK